MAVCMVGSMSGMLFGLVFVLSLLVILCLLAGFLAQRRLVRAGWWGGAVLLVMISVAAYSAWQMQAARRASVVREQVQQKVEKLQKEAKQPAPLVSETVPAENVPKEEPTELSPEERQQRRQRDGERRSFGRQLGGIENDLRGSVGGYNGQIAAVNAQYRDGDMDSYEELIQKAHLEIAKQDAILAAMEEKLSLLSQARFLTEEDKAKDIEDINERKRLAQQARAEYMDVLQQVKDNEDVFRSL